MSNRILIDATYMQQELRVAVVNNGVVNHLDIESIAKQQTKAYIYKGKVTRVEPSLEACFVDYGVERHGFLPLKDIAPQYYNHHSQSFSHAKSEAEADANQESNEQQDHQHKKISIKDVIKEGQELIVQVEKIERGNKGAALTTYITLAGSYLVLMPNSPKAGGVSRRIEGQERSELLDILKQLTTPDNMGIIIRTASVGKSLDELQWDLDILVSLWGSIEKIANQHDKPVLIHQESNAMIRALRDYLRQDIDEIVINDVDVYNEARKYVERIRPNFVDKVKLHESKTPLFTQYQIEKQVSIVFNREVRLPSGGSIVIDLTEALVSIDINSAKATKGGDIEETALVTNLEAATEIARQLRLRDLGGLIVIDFIDMLQPQNQREVEDRLRMALHQDRAKVQTGRISRFGLLELSRQRLRATLAESTKLTCPHCQGHGLIRSIPSLSLSILRAVEDTAREENVSQVRAHLPVEIATFLLNDQRDALSNIEKKFGVTILLIPNVHLTAPNYEIERIRDGVTETSTASYKIAAELKGITDSDMSNYGLDEKKTIHMPALQTIELPERKAPSNNDEKNKRSGFITRLFKAIFLGASSMDKSATQKPNGSRGKRRYHGKSQSRRGSYTNQRNKNNNRGVRSGNSQRRHNQQRSSNNKTHSKTN